MTNMGLGLAHVHAHAHAHVLYGENGTTLITTTTWTAALANPAAAPARVVRRS